VKERSRCRPGELEWRGSMRMEVAEPAVQGRMRSTEAADSHWEALQGSTSGEELNQARGDEQCSAQACGALLLRSGNGLNAEGSQEGADRPGSSVPSAVRPRRPLSPIREPPPTSLLDVAGRHERPRCVA
jgi:hypothetical protein